MKRTITFILLTASVVALSHRPLQGQNQQSQEPAEKSLINSLDGRVLYTTYCASCHGNEARGNGPMAGALKTPPPDLTQIAVRNGGVFNSRRVTQLISGESELLSHGTREMPLWGPIFSQIAWDQDLGRIRVANLVRYLETIQTAAPIGGTFKR